MNWGFAVALILLVGALIAYRKYKHIYYPGFFLLILFAGISFFAAFHLFKVNAVSNRIWLIVLIGMLLFSVGCRAAQIVTLSHHLGSSKKELAFSYSFIYCAAAICIASMAAETLTVIRYLIQGYGFDYIRTIYYDLNEVKTSSSISDVINLYLIGPVSIAIKPIAIVDYLSGKRNKVLLSMAVLIIVLEALTSGGRMVVFNLLLIIVFALLIIKQKISISPKQKKALKRIAIFAIVGIVVITMSRGASEIKEIYMYVCGCLPHLEARTDIVDMNSWRTFGMASLYGIMTPILFLFKNLGIIAYPAIYLQAVTWSNVQNYIMIGDGVYFNAYVTPLYSFYLDGGVLGVAIGMLIFGIICGSAYKSVQKSLNPRSIVILLLIIQGLFKCVTSFPFTITSYCLSFFYVYLFTVRVRQTNGTGYIR